MNVASLLAASDPMLHVLPHTVDGLSTKSPWTFEIFGGLVRLGPTISFTSHLLMLLIVAAIMIIVFPLLAKNYPRVPTGIRNFFEAIMEFIRNEVAKPSLHDNTDRFMPFLWTLFFFILFNNLMGLIPLDSLSLLIVGRGHLFGTATAGLSITAGLAICSFIMFHNSGSSAVYRSLREGTYGVHHDGGDEHGHGGHGHAHAAKPGMSAIPAMLAAPLLYIWNFAPHVFKPEPGASAAVAFTLTIADVAMWAVLLVLECIGAVVKPFALAMRLFANMLAGHVVLASLLAMIPMLHHIADWGVAVPTLLGCAGLSCLELFVAFLQAYIFVFLTAMFIGAAVNPEH